MKSFMEIYWLKVGRNVYGNSWKNIWPFSNDYNGTPPAGGKLKFSQFSDNDSMKHLLSLQLWQLFKYEDLTEVVRQNDKLFIDLLNKVWVGNIDDDVKNLLKTRFTSEPDGN